MWILLKKCLASVHEVDQLFGHLDSEIKDNPVFNKYEEERINWEGPSTTQYRSWKFPSNFDDAKSFVYGLYRTIGESDSAAVDLPMTMTHVNHGDLNDDIDNFNSHFLEYFEQVLMDIINANPEYEIHSVYNTWA